MMTTPSVLSGGQLTEIGSDIAVPSTLEGYGLPGIDVPLWEQIPLSPNSGNIPGNVGSSSALGVSVNSLLRTKRRQETIELGTRKTVPLKLPVWDRNNPYRPMESLEDLVAICKQNHQRQLW